MPEVIVQQSAVHHVPEDSNASWLTQRVSCRDTEKHKQVLLKRTGSGEGHLHAVQWQDTWMGKKKMANLIKGNHCTGKRNNRECDVDCYKYRFPGFIDLMCNDEKRKVAPLKSIRLHNWARLELHIAGHLDKQRHFRFQREDGICWRKHCESE